MGLTDLIRKFDVAGPRYTSYPTAPIWKESIAQPDYERTLMQLADHTSRDFSLYVHIPFCESLCFYCGCNIHLTKDTNRSLPYVDALLREMRAVSLKLPFRAQLQQVSWGGGTPTFLSVAQIRHLYAGIREHFDIHPDAEVSIEIDPRVTSFEQLETLRELGFNRVSLGIQDFDEEVQKAIHRVQTVEETSRLLAKCRDLGFTGINFDLIYGLPFQNTEKFKHSLERVRELSPDRIAFYNYAHLPSLRPHQKILEKYPMPSAAERVDMFLLAYYSFIGMGYHAIGMDHFAKANDELYRSLSTGGLYRNFMGYTVKRSPQMIGVGASAIGEFPNAYFQNVRETGAYESRITETGNAIFRGCLLSLEDRKRKWVIQALMCAFRLDYAKFQTEFGEPFPSAFPDEFMRLREFVEDGILILHPERIEVTELGRLFVRNVAMVFDAYLTQKAATYSRTV